jgi:hypothetical protein
MQRTRAESSLQRSMDVEALEDDLGPSASETAACGASTTPTASGVTGVSSISGPSGVGRYLNTPRGRLLQTLAAEAAHAQKERSLRDIKAAVPTYSGVMGAVDAALRSAASSPTKIPLAACPSGGIPAHYASPSKIPRPAALALCAGGSDDENLGSSAPPSPAKEAPAAAPRWGGALRASVENLRRAAY